MRDPSDVCVPLKAQRRDQDFSFLMAPFGRRHGAAVTAPWRLRCGRAPVPPALRLTRITVIALVRDA